MKPKRKAKQEMTVPTNKTKIDDKNKMPKWLIYTFAAKIIFVSLITIVVVFIALK